MSTTGESVLETDHGDVGSVGEYRLLTMLIGAVIGVSLAASSRIDQVTGEKDLTPWLIFVLVGGLLGAAAGEAFGFGFGRWREVKRYHSIRLWRVWLSIVLMLVIAAALIYSARYAFEDTKTLSWRGAALAGLAIAGGLSSAATLAAIRQVAADPLPGSPGQQLNALLRMRQMSSRMLSQLGVLVLLIIAVNVAGANWGETRQDPNVGIFSGVVASFVIATIYVPTASALRRRGAIFVERNFSLADTGVAELVDAAEERQKLEKMLGLDQTTFGELKAGFVVLTPIVVAFLASFVKTTH
ncbi:MAG TPA: hypothetical protein VF062_22970 [Candidatus Limnocylindrales bacterium]